MSSEDRPPRKIEEISQTEDPVDLIYLHFDGINQRLPFRMADYGDDGALTGDQIEYLAQSFLLDLRLAQELSVLLGYSLDIDSKVSLIRVKREHHAPNKTSEGKEFKASYVDDNGNEVVVRPLDKRKVADDRRLSVVESCCYIWLDAGRKLTFTTRADKLKPEQQREGELIRFIQTAVSMVTTPTCEVSGETLRRDIELTRRRFRRRGEMVPTNRV
ncbi:hypothetical protein [Sediminimonas qiaohouensis]|uniref:hypothetical protein n=1 Tax=Sediminimonas qiaohouensis TaxID=552061 RepID=UPI00047BFAC7|nr:hypothetical protein [Sediminimonas qiaohouensis]